MNADESLQLADWRRHVADSYARWREESKGNPEEATARLRAERDQLFRGHPQSPLQSSDRARFGGLPYFSYDSAYRFTARLEADSGEQDNASSAPDPVAPLLQLPSSGDEPFSFTRIGRLALAGPLDGESLPVFWMAGYAGGLFVPFQDATAGLETYGAGRYLFDSVKGADLGGDYEKNELLIDFNVAYHPSCAYDPRWNCPLAPPESRISMPIRVGERLG